MEQAEVQKTVAQFGMSKLKLTLTVKYFDQGFVKSYTMKVCATQKREHHEGVTNFDGLMEKLH